ncbi:MAG: MobH family relaxase [Burkholderiales bacterium]
MYPPIDAGLPTCTAKDLLDGNSSILRRLRQVASSSDADFAARYLGPIESLANYILLLPASSHEVFAGPGGLFRYCLEVGYYALQASDERIFTPNASVEVRHELEGRYRYATFLAGLLAEVSTPLASVVVTDAEGATWPKFTTPLADWLAERRLTRYWVSWQSDRHREQRGAEASAVYGSILPKEQLTWLDRGAPQIVRDLFAVASGNAKSGDSIMADLVESIRTKVRKHDELTRPQRFGHWRCGHQMEVHLLDAMRHLVSTGVWSASGKSPALLYGSDGLYLRWPECAEDLRREIEKRALVGLPRDPYTVADALGAAGALVAREPGEHTWSVIEAKAGASVFTALRWRDPVALLGYNVLVPDQHPYAEYLVRQRELINPGSAIGKPETAAGYAFPPGLVTQVGSAKDEEDKVAAPRDPLDALRRKPKDESPEVAAPPLIQQASGSAAPSPPEVSPTVTGMVEQYRKILKADEVRMIARWIELLQSGRTDQVKRMDDGSIAISQDAVDRDLSSLVGAMDRRGFLGVIPNAARGARAGHIDFGGTRKIGFVIDCESARGLGLVVS